MPKGPRGEKRPADAIGRAVHIAKIATGEIVEEVDAKAKASASAAVLGRRGGKARAKSLSPEERSAIARKAAAARYAKA